MDIKEKLSGYKPSDVRELSEQRSYRESKLDGVQNLKSIGDIVRYMRKNRISYLVMDSSGNVWSFPAFSAAQDSLSASFASVLESLQKHAGCAPQDLSKPWRFDLTLSVYTFSSSTHSKPALFFLDKQYGGIDRAFSEKIKEVVGCGGGALICGGVDTMSASNYVLDNIDCTPEIAFNNPFVRSSIHLEAKPPQIASCGIIRAIPEKALVCVFCGPDVQSAVTCLLQRGSVVVFSDVSKESVLSELRRVGATRVQCQTKRICDMASVSSSSVSEKAFIVGSIYGYDGENLTPLFSRDISAQ